MFFFLIKSFIYWIYCVVGAICCALCLLEPKKGELCNGLKKFHPPQRKVCARKEQAFLFFLFLFFWPFVDLLTNGVNMVQCKNYFPLLFFWPLCGPTIFFTIFIKSTTCFSFLCGPTLLLSFCFTSNFFHLKPMGEKNIFIYLLMILCSMKIRIFFLFCLLLTWASMWYYIIWKEFFWMSLQVINKNYSRNEIPYKGGNITSILS